MALETKTSNSETVMSDHNFICSCCLIPGCIKDINTEYYDTGESEVYSEMIRNTFNINITHDIQKNLPQTLYKQYICEQCIVQLRNAYAFKVRVMKNQDAFLWRLTKWQKAGFKDEDISPKTNKIKLEWNHSNEMHDNFYNEGQLKEFDNELKNTSIKQESTVEGMIHAVNNQIGLINTEKQKNIVKMSTKKSENKLNSTKKRNSKEEVNRRKNNNLDGVKKTKRTKNAGAAGTILRDNSLKLMSNSTLWVFQWKGHGEYLCYLCRQSYTDIEALKNHTKTHTLQEIEKKITNSSNARVKVEISDLFCKICTTKLDNLQELQKHLKIHGFIINEHLLVPFRLNDENKCQLCWKIFKNFRILKSHMLKHYQSFVCEICGAEFYKKEYLISHITNRHTDKKTRTKLKFNCQICAANFSTYPRKIEHMVQNHNMKKPEFPCKLCSKVYVIKGLLNRHMKLTHLNDFKEKNYECDICFKRFHRSHDVTRHKETHSEGLNYSCEVCNHSFKLKTSLGRHMRRMHK